MTIKHASVEDVGFMYSVDIFENMKDMHLLWLKQLKEGRLEQAEKIEVDKCIASMWWHLV